MNLYEKVIHVLKELFEGKEIEFQINENISQKVILENNQLKTISIKSQNNSMNVSMSSNISLNDFLRICNNMTIENSRKKSKLNMNIGERIVEKCKRNEEDFSQEIKDLENLLYKVQKNIKPIIGFNTEYCFDFNFTNQIIPFLKIVDDKLFEVQEKILEPENIVLNVEINSTYLGDWSSLSFKDETETINMDDIYVTNKIDKSFHYPISEFFRNTFWMKLLVALNINYWVFLIAAHQYETNSIVRDKIGNLKIISTNNDT